MQSSLDVEARRDSYQYIYGLVEFYVLLVTYLVEILSRTYKNVKAL